MITDYKTIGKIKCGDFEVDNLYIEGTRKCNFTCPDYCYHGKAQNLSMSRETLNAILDNFDGKKIESVVLQGGEYNADLDALDTIGTALREHKTNFAQLRLVTNGYKLKPEFLKMLDDISKLADKTNKQKVYFTMSNDEYHGQEFTRLGDDLETSHEKFLELGERYPHFYFLNRTYRKKHEIELYPCGNALKQRNGKFEPISTDPYIIFRDNKKRDKLCLINIEFDAKGNVVKQLSDYCGTENDNHGNVHTHNMTDVYLQHGHYARLQ